MKTKFIIPVIDTERGVFEYNGKKMTREEFGDLEWEHFLKTNRQMNRFTENIRMGISNIQGNVRNYDDKEHPDIYYNDEEVECIVLNARREEVNSDFFKKHVDTGKMFILNINLNPDTMSGDAKSETRYWAEDSRRVLNDHTLSEEMQLRTLQPRYFFIEDGENEILLNNCKIIQIYSNKKNPFNYAIIVEKASYVNEN